MNSKTSSATAFSQSQSYEQNMQYLKQIAMQANHLIDLGNHLCQIKVFLR
jgi:uncharacterized protein YaaW (UPF0174 family)